MSCRRAICAPAGGFLGAPMYTCGTSSPAALPVLRMVKLTSRPPSVARAALSRVYWNVLYDRPYPKGKSGLMFRSGAGGLAGVADGEAHVQAAIGGAGGFEQGVLERAVRQAVPEGEERLDVLLIEPAVPPED